MSNPVTAPRKPPVGKSFAEKHPELVSEWSSENDHSPKEIFARSGIKIKWICSTNNNHTWEASPEKRSKGRGCPYCSGRKVHEDDTLLARFPEIAEEWHPSKNELLAPTDLSSTSRKRIWWKCSQCSRQWKTSIINRTKHFHLKGSAGKCSNCNNMLGKSSIAETHPYLIDYWDDNLDIQNFGYRCRKEIKWRCPDNSEHKWKAPVSAVASKTNICPFCCKKKGINSFRHLKKEWSNKNKNVEFKDASLLTKYWWQCQKEDNHIWQASVHNRIQDQSGCPFCAGKRVSKDNNLEALNPKLAAEWHQTKNKTLASEHRPGTHKIAWWQCPDNPRHEWQAAILDRSNGDSCPFCANKKVIPDENSFAALQPEEAKYWSYELNDSLPTDWAAGAHKDVWWQCPKNSDHIWKQSIKSSSSTGVTCSNCTGFWNPYKFKQFLNLTLKRNESVSCEEWKEIFEESKIYSKGYPLENESRFVAKFLSENKVSDKEIFKYINNGDSVIVEHLLEQEKIYRIRKPIPAKLKSALFKRDLSECQNPYCLFQDVSKDELEFHIDHIVPHIFGGPNTLENLQLLCQNCNNRKWATNWKEFLRLEKLRQN